MNGKGYGLQATGVGQECFFLVLAVAGRLLPEAGSCNKLIRNQGF
jgi:hypothetical protein